MASEMTFKKHRPVDTTDPGFTLPGKQLRWINGRVSENNPGRPWVVLREKALPKELVEYLRDHNPEVFSGGDTIRRGDLVLGYTSNEAHAVLKKEKMDAAYLMENKVRRGPDAIGKDGRNKLKLEVNEDQDVTQQMIARFKASNKE